LPTPRSSAISQISKRDAVLRRVPIPAGHAVTSSLMTDTNVKKAGHGSRSAMSSHDPFADILSNCHITRHAIADAQSIIEQCIAEIETICGTSGNGPVASTSREAPSLHTVSQSAPSAPSKPVSG
jgi:hypothetical protein